MSNPLFSIARYLSKDVLTPGGRCIGTLKDLIGDERSGKLTYFIIEGKEKELYAIHHSYFYQLQSPVAMVFDQELGNKDFDYFADLPTDYLDDPVYTCIDLLQQEIPELVTAEHRSDNEFPR